MTLSRRELFAKLRPSHDRAPADPPAPRVAPDPAPPRPADTTSADAPGPAFSLDAFYAGRRTDRELPVFTVRTTAAETSTVGTGPRHGAAHAPSPPARAATAIAPTLVPQLLPQRCLATTSFCSVCVEHCPTQGAIVVQHGRPRVVAARCDGCGRCVATCPAPILAFTLVPRPEPP